MCHVVYMWYECTYVCVCGGVLYLSCMCLGGGSICAMDVRGVCVEMCVYGVCSMYVDMCVVYVDVCVPCEPCGEHRS